MLEQLNNSLVFTAFFIASKQGKTGLTVTVDCYNPAGTQVVTGASATEVGDGLYKYTLTSTNVTTAGEYTAVFKTTDATVDQQHIPSQYSVSRAGIAHLDADVSSRMATFSLPSNFASLGITAGGHVSNVDTVGTLTTYTGNTPQTGDAYARLGAPAGASVSADIAAIETHVASSGVIVATNNDKTGYSVSSTGLDAVIVEGVKLRQAIGVIYDCAPNGIITGAGTTTVTVKNNAGSSTRAVLTVDPATGNRSAATITPEP